MDNSDFDTSKLVHFKQFFAERPEQVQALPSISNRADLLGACSKELLKVSIRCPLSQR